MKPGSKTVPVSPRIEVEIYQCGAHHFTSMLAIVTEAGRFSEPDIGVNVGSAQAMADILVKLDERLIEHTEAPCAHTIKRAFGIAADLRVPCIVNVIVQRPVPHRLDTNVTYSFQAVYLPHSRLLFLDRIKEEDDHVNPDNHG